MWLACSNSTEDDYMGLVEQVQKQYPNTKVIPYPYQNVDEQETLMLLDDVLNMWGRQAALPSTFAKNVLTL